MTSLVGHTLAGKYALTRVHHRGLISTVYTGEQRIGANARPVAVKVLESTEPEDQARFTSGATTCARLESRHSVPALDFGQTESGQGFLVMPMVAGERAFAGPMPVARVAHVLGQLCSVLEELHGLSLAYLHLKPGHLLLDASDTLTLIDFSSASTFGAPRLGAVPGAAPYMSPEQVAGEPHDARSDVYAMAEISHELLTGVTPFHDRGEPTIPEPIRDALAIGLARDPESRFRSVSELFAAISARS